MKEEEDYSNHQIKVRPKKAHAQASQIVSEKNHRQVNHESHEQRSVYSTKSMRHKMSDVVLNEIVKNSKNGRNRQNSSIKDKKRSFEQRNKLLHFASKMTGSKKLKQNYSKIACQICQCEVLRKEMESVSDCGHEFCQLCLQQCIIFKISSFQSPQCPNENCSKIIDQKSSLYSKLPFQIRKKFEKWKQYQSVIENKNKKLCPHEECEGVIDLASLQETAPECSICHRKYCQSCWFQKHEGECDPHQLNFFQNTLHFRRCEKCLNVVQKSSGCNHITCRCGYQFCYICGGKWKHDHLCKQNQHLQNGQRPAYEPDCDCCCIAFDCDEECCGCCQSCCQGCVECCGAMCQCCCFCDGQCCGCCNSCCDYLENNCCECCCQDRSCCCSCCNFCMKLTFSFIWSILVLPFFYLMLFIFLVIRTIGGILAGIFFGPCLYYIHLEESYDEVQWWQILVMIVLFPFTLLYFISLGIRYTVSGMFIDEDEESLFCMPCYMYKQIFEDQ